MFLDKYKDKLRNNGKDRYPTMQLALNWFEANGGTTIVETGCVRQKDDFGAGMSTVLFGEYAKAHPYQKFVNADGWTVSEGVQFYSIDISPENIATAEELTKGLPVLFIRGDSVDALSVFSESIDLLYLDSRDCDPNPATNNDLPQAHQLAEFQAAEQWLYEGSCVLLDDCGFENGGKCGLLKPYLRSQGWKCLWDGYQSLWVNI